MPDPGEWDQRVLIVADEDQADARVLVVPGGAAIDVDMSGASDGQVLTVQPDGSLAAEAPAAGGLSEAEVLALIDANAAPTDRPGLLKAGFWQQAYDVPTGSGFAGLGFPNGTAVDDGSGTASAGGITEPTRGWHVLWATGAVLNQLRGRSTNAYAVLTAAWRVISMWRFALVDTASLRTFIGWSTERSANTLTADAPSSASYYGLQASTGPAGRGDTTWQYTWRKDSGAQTIIDTSVTITANQKLILVQEVEADGDLKVTLYDDDMGELWTTTIAAANLTALTMRWCTGIQTLDTVTKGFRHYGIQVATR